MSITRGLIKLFYPVLFACLVFLVSSPKVIFATTPEAPICGVNLADANGDNFVNGADFAIWKNEFNIGTGLNSDFNHDQKVDGLDFILWKTQYLSPVACVTPTSDPLPTPTLDPALPTAAPPIGSDPTSTPVPSVEPTITPVATSTPIEPTPTFEGNNVAPVGVIDVAPSTCTTLIGWTWDPNSPNVSIGYHVYTQSLSGGSPFYIGAGVANISRPDVGVHVGDNGMHGYSYTIPEAYQNKDYQFFVYGLDEQGDNTKNAPLNNSPMVSRCP